MRKLTHKLIEKSQGCFLLALELYNKPTIQYRTESFAILATNSWELLLKARLYEKSDGKMPSIFRKKVRNQKRESISIDECLNKAFDDGNDPVKRNIEFISELRNEATHLVIDYFNPYYSRVFQACVINYLASIELWFGRSPKSLLSPGFLSLIVDDQQPELSEIRNKFNKEDFINLSRWVDKYKGLEELGEKATISIAHKIAIVKNPSKADFIISSGSTGKEISVIERTRDLDHTHPYRSKDVIDTLNSMLGAARVNTYNLQAFLFINGYKGSNNDHYWKTKFGVSQYSERVLTEMYQAIEQNPKIINVWRHRYRTHLRLTKRSHWRRKPLRASGQTVQT